MIFTYSKIGAYEHLKDLVLKMYQDLPSESNHIIEKWKDIGYKSETAFSSQGLIELKNNYCDLKKCLTCSIGNAILKSG